MLTTHYLEEAEELCDRIAIINHGKLIANKPTRELVDMEAAGDPDAEAAFARLYDRWGRALALLAGMIDPDVIVLGGGLSNLPDAPARARAAMLPYVFSDLVETDVRRAVHGDSSGVRGAAWLWNEEDPR